MTDNCSGKSNAAVDFSAPIVPSELVGLGVPHSDPPLVLDDDVFAWDSLGLSNLEPAGRADPFASSCLDCGAPLKLTTPLLAFEDATPITTRATLQTVLREQPACICPI